MRARSMSQDKRCGIGDIFGHYVRAVAQRRHRPRNRHQRLGSPCAEYLIALAGDANSPHDVERVFKYRLGHMKTTDPRSELAKTLRRKHGLQRSYGVSSTRALQQAAFDIAAWQTERNRNAEPVALSLDQRKRPSMIHRVLRSDNKEGCRQSIRASIDTHLLFGHCLKQSRLGTGCRSVQFVEEQHVGEYRSVVKLPRPFLSVEGIDANNVGRQQVGRTLKPAKAARQESAECARQDGLAHAGFVLEHEVRSSEQGGYRKFYLATFAKQNRFDGVDKGARKWRR